MAGFDATPSFNYGGGGGMSSTTSGHAGLPSELPAWLPTPDHVTRELLQQYGDTSVNKEIATLQKSGDETQGAVVSTAMNAANNAATEYANRARQAGGNAAGAGLIRAEGQVKGQAAAGQIKMENAKAVLAAREKAAGLASQIATNLGSLRIDYLKTLATYDIQNRQLGLSEEEMNRKRSGYNVTIGSGGGMDFQNKSAWDQYLQNNSGRQTPYGRWG